MAVTKQIIQERGFGSNGINKGLMATIGRNGVFNMVYFGFYHSVRNYFPAFQVSTSIIYIHNHSIPISHILI